MAIEETTATTETTDAIGDWKVLYEKARKTIKSLDAQLKELQENSIPRDEHEEILEATEADFQRRLFDAKASLAQTDEELSDAQARIEEASTVADDALMMTRRRYIIAYKFLMAAKGADIDTPNARKRLREINAMTNLTTIETEAAEYHTLANEFFNTKGVPQVQRAEILRRIQTDESAALKGVEANL